MCVVVVVLESMEFYLYLALNIDVNGFILDKEKIH